MKKMMTRALAAVLSLMLIMQAPLPVLAAEDPQAAEETVPEEVLAEETGEVFEAPEETGQAGAEDAPESAGEVSDEEEEALFEETEEALSEETEEVLSGNGDLSADSQGDAQEILEETAEEEEIAGYEANLGTGTLSTGLTWTVSSDGVLSFKKSGTGTWEIPSFDKEKSPWYSIRAKIKALTLPEADGAALKIGRYAFYGLTALTSVQVPDNVSSVGTGAFMGCSALKTCAWNSAAALPESVFQNCTALNEFDSYAEIAAIGKNAFNGCKSLTQLDFLSMSMQSIGDSAFAGCSKLAKIYLASKLTSVGSSVFVNQASLTVYIPAQFQTESVYSKMRSAYSKVKWAVNFEGSYPLLTSADAGLKGVTVKWKHLEGATDYIIYRKPQSGSDEDWDILSEYAVKSGTASGASLSYTDTSAQSGKAYSYTVQGYQESMDLLTACNVAGDLASTAFYTAPEACKVSNTKSGAKISWNAVSGVSSYRVYYREGSGSFSRLADVEGTSYTNEKAKSNVSCTYTVACLKDGKVVSGYQGGTANTFYAVPVVTCTRKTDSIKISWEDISGIDDYRVYYRIGNGEWTKLTDVKGNSYTWKGAASGKDYFFTVRCVKGGKQVSSYNSGRECLFYKAPTVKAVNAAKGVKVSWNTSKGVDAYRVYYKTETGDWKVLKDVKGSSYTWTGAKTGSKYFFTVRCVKGGKQVSSYRSGVWSRFYPAVTVSSAKKVSGGIKISWKAIKGVKMYRVYYKTGSGKYKKLKDLSGSSYTWKGAKSGTKYSFIVRVVSKDGKTVYSAESNAKTVTY